MPLPIYAWISALVVALLLSWWSYRFLWSQHALWKWASVVRFFAVFLCVIWLFNPSITSTSFKQIPAKFDVYIDVSKSNQTEQDSAIRFIERWQQENKNIDFTLWAFSETVVPWNQRNTLGGNQTRLDRVYEHMRQHKDRATHKLLITDGIENQGRMLSTFNLDKVGPVSVLGMGDTTVKADVFVTDLLMNKEVFQGNSTEAEARLTALNVKGKEFNIKWLVDGSVSASETWIPKNDKEQKRVRFSLNSSRKKGNWVNVTCEISGFPQEENKTNNQKTKTLRIRDNSRKIHVIYGAPHPDIKAIRLALRDKEAYELTLSSDDEMLPQNRDVYIAHGVTNVNALDKLSQMKAPIWWFAPDVFSLSRVLQNSELTMLRRGLKGSQEVFPGVNDNFGYFELPQNEGVSRTWKAISSPYVSINRPVEQVQLWQVWAGSRTQIPLMYTENLTRVQHVFLGSGIWQWRMNEMRVNNEATQFDAWVSRNIQYLSRASENTSGWEFFGFPEEINKGERIKLKWQFRDDAGELRTKPGVKAFASISGKRISLPLYVENNTYVGYVDLIDAGDIAVWVQDGTEKQLGLGVGTVRAQSQELDDLRARHDVLANFAKTSMGIFSDFRNKDKWRNSIQTSGLDAAVIKETEKTQAIDQWIWFMLALFTLFGIEWFIRKWMGKI